MTSPERHEPYEERAAGLARVARLVDDRLDVARDAAGRERMLVALSRRSRSPSRSSVARGGWLLAAALAVAAAAGAGILLERGSRALQYQVTGPLVTDGSWLGVAPSGGALAVRFSDGTEVDLGPGSKGQVADVTADGARVVLAAGVLQARVVHRARARWSVAAGPYTIEVTGTAFDVGWSAAGQVLDLSLHDGSVIVRGPSLPDGLRVAAGQRLVARAATGDAQLSSLLAPAPSAAASVPAPTTPGPEDAPEESSQARRASRPQATWSEMLADGNFRAVIDAAEARGVDSTLRHGSLADVVALADAARYLRERALAKRGLLAERSRFAGSAEARGAAFVLGRLADDGGARDEAIRWYDTYLAESPRGSFAAEALGRKLVALVELGDPGGARAVAKDYLSRFPNGAHAAYARDHAKEP